jgi:hypothetical protein
MARDPIKITCPHCGSLYQLADGTIKEVVRSELVNADESDFEAPVRELIYKILEKGGANELATNLVDMATGKEVAMNVKLRALDIIGSLFKHSEKLSPPERNLDDLDREELQAYVDRKMGVAAPPLASSGPAPPKWLQVADEKKQLKKMSSALTLEEAAELMTAKLSGKKWFVKADTEKEPAPAVLCYVTSYAALPADLIQGKGIWGGFPIRLQKVKTDGVKADAATPKGNPGVGGKKEGSPRPVGTAAPPT